MTKIFDKVRIIFFMIIVLILLSGCTQNFLHRFISIITDQSYMTNKQSNDSILLLVNYDHPLPKNYQINLMTLENGEKVADVIYRPLMQMFNDMCLAGIYPKVASGYRNYNEQKQILQQRINEYHEQGYSVNEAQDLAREWVALPDASEHQTGLAIDINPYNELTNSNDLYDWLENNSHRYGFIKRYSSEKKYITKINEEPWHYRYVGVTAATAIYEQKICLEEYLLSYQ